MRNLSFISKLGLGALLVVAGASSAWGQRLNQAVGEISLPFASGFELQSGRIDTRIGDQITKVQLGGRVMYPENPPIHRHEISNLPPATAPFGGLTAEKRAIERQRFPGIDMDRWAPPDPTLAVGPEYVVATVNMKIAFFRKSDGVKVFERWLGNQETNGFFRSVGALDFTFDPKCLYDTNTGRFIVIVPEYYSSPRTSKICVAVSDDSDPNGVWYLYRTESKVTNQGSEYWLDYPGLGVDQNAIYVCGNMFGFSSGFGGVLFRAYPIAPLLNGGPITWWDFLRTSSASAQAAHASTTTNAGFFVEVGSTSSMRLLAIRDVLSNPTLVTTTVSVPSFSNPNSSAPQQGGGTIDVLDGRIMNVYWRNGKMLAGHGIRSNSGNRTVGRWYEFNTGTWPQSGSPTLAQSGNVDSGGSNYHMFPALAYNDFGDAGMIIGRSSSTQFAGVYVTGRKRTDAAGTMGALVEARRGTAAYTGGRWGDYFGAQVDPADGLTFWGIGEICESSGSWRTWITSWRVATYWNLFLVAVVNGVPTTVPVTVTTDGRGDGNGDTPLTRTYYDQDVVVMEVPASVNGVPFRRWVSPAGNTGISLNNPRLQMVMRGHLNLAAQYEN